MIETLTILIFIQIALVMLIDISGFIDFVKKKIWERTYPGHAYRDFEFKPFGCSFCMTHHIGLLYLIFAGKFTLMLYVLLLLLAYFTTTTKNILILVKDFIDGIIYKLQRLTDKLSE